MSDSYHPPFKRKFSLSVAIPASVTSEVPDLRERTFRLGLIARALAIFRVDEVLIYRDRMDVGIDEAELVELMLRYLECPQYLRRRVFPLDLRLKFAGTLPPLQIPHHFPGGRGFVEGMRFKEGMVVKRGRKGIWVDAGLRRPLLCPGEFRQVGSRVTVEVMDEGAYTAKTADRSKINIYWGYEVKVVWRALGDMVKGYKSDLVIATAKEGACLEHVEEELAGRLRNAERVLMLFGSQREGLFEIAEREGVDLGELCDFAINFIPCQGTRTVRTEEALFCCLTAVNLLAHRANADLIPAGAVNQKVGAI